ncbi:hypothetical protein [Embleya sp. NPDC005575]|uniref:hypothetical protein n=1 Tax=Embleya sp. NPDC005575 TaxID=3156892 RepID=UPI0033A50E2D
MAPMLCATMSCSSRAIRSRSACTAEIAVCARNASAWSWRSRSQLPRIQAATAATASAEDGPVSTVKTDLDRLGASFNHGIWSFLMIGAGAVGGSGSGGKSGRGHGNRAAAESNWLGTAR